MLIRYTKWNEELFKSLKNFQELLRLFNYLVLLHSGDVEKTFRLLKSWQRQGLIPPDFNLDQFRETLEKEDYINREKGAFKLTQKGERSIRKSSLKMIFDSLKKGGLGDHLTPQEGTGSKEYLPERKPYQFGDDVGDIDFKDSILESLKRTKGEDFTFQESDFRVCEVEHLTSCATVLLLDISHSMILYGEDRITPAKQVALALTELILTEFAKDSLNVVLFGDNAFEVSLKDLPYVQVGPYYTNTKSGLQLARQILSRKKHPNKQIFLITDGKPSMVQKSDGSIYRNSVGLDPIIVNRTLDEAVICRRKKIPITTFMVTSDPYLQTFVQKFTELNKGRAYFTSPDRLGEYIFWDFIQHRRKKVK